MILQDTTLSLEAVRNLLVLLASGISIVGIPTLITLLFRFYDAKLKLQEKQSSKSVKDEIFALKELQELQITQLRSKISETESNTIEAGPLEGIPVYGMVMPKFAVLKRVQDLSCKLAFDLSSNEGRQIFEEIVEHISEYKDCYREGAPELRCLFSKYEESLTRQVGQLERDEIKS